jgi:hypothetical protein
VPHETHHSQRVERPRQEKVFVGVDLNREVVQDLGLDMPTDRVDAHP